MRLFRRVFENRSSVVIARFLIDSREVLCAIDWAEDFQQENR